jgi:hypothetical protein
VQESDLAEARAAWNDCLVDLVAPGVRRRVGEVAVEAKPRRADLRAFAQAGRGGRDGGRAAALPFLQVGPVRQVGRDDVADRPEDFDLAPQFRIESRRGMEPHVAGSEADHGHAHRERQAHGLLRPAVHDPDVLGDGL